MREWNCDSNNIIGSQKTIEFLVQYNCLWELEVLSVENYVKVEMNNFIHTSDERKASESFLNKGLELNGDSLKYIKVG